MSIKKLQNFSALKLTGDPTKDTQTLRDLLAKFEDYICGNVPILLNSGEYIPLSQKGVGNGVATLGSNGMVSPAQLPTAGNISAEISARIAGDMALSNTKQNSYPILSTLGVLTDAVGWLHNNGSGVLAYSTPTYSEVGADIAGAAAAITLAVLGGVPYTGASSDVNLGSHTITTNLGLQTVGAADSGGTGYKMVRVPN